MEYFAGLEHLTYVETTAYRDNEVGLGIQLEARLEELRNESTEDCERVVSRRLSRILGGGFAVLAAAAMVLTLVVPLIYTPVPHHNGSYVEYSGYEPSGWPVHLLLVGSFGGLLVTLLSRVFLGWLVTWFIRRTLRVSGDTFADLDRLRHVKPNEILAKWAVKLERASVALPLVAASLLGPLTVHRLIVFGMSAREFNQWIGVSMLIVGHCHIALAIFAVSFSKKLHASGSPRVLGKSSGWRAYWIAVTLSLLPALFLLGIPTIMVAGTGLFFVPWMFRAAGSKIERERILLGIEEHDRNDSSSLFSGVLGRV